MKTRHFFAVDLGATSGRTILGTLSDGKMDMKEVTRFAKSTEQPTIIEPRALSNSDALYISSIDIP